MENRVKWCQEHEKTRWNNWIFSDESKFELYDYKNRRWARSKPSLMIWGAISSKGKSKLIFIRGIVNSKKYQEILKEAEPSLKNFIHLLLYSKKTVHHVTLLCLHLNGSGTLDGEFLLGQLILLTSTQLKMYGR